MKIVLAPDSYKGSLSAAEVCHILTEEIHGVNGEISGQYATVRWGEGLLDCLEQALGDDIPLSGTDPIGRSVDSTGI